MTCEQIRPLLSALVDGELSSWEQSSVRAHIASCEGCRETLEAFSELPSLVARHVAPPELSAAQAEQLDLALELALDRERPRRRGLIVDFRPLVAAAAGALIAVGLSTWVFVAVEDTSLAFTPRVLPDLAFADPVVRLEASATNGIEGAALASSVASLTAAQRAALARDGLVQVPGDSEELSGFYGDSAVSGARPLVTADAALLVHGGAVQRAALEVERAHVAPGVRAVLGAVARELERFDEHRAADPSATTLARGVVAVALALEGDALALPPSLARDVDADVTLARAARGISPSRILGRDVDWAAFEPRGLLRTLPDHARAVSWLSAASLRLDPEHATETRAALLVLLALSRAALPDGTSALVAWNEVEDAASFLHGPPDDLGLFGALAVARAALGSYPAVAALDDRDKLARVWERAARLARADGTGRVRTLDEPADDPRVRLLGGTRSLESLVLSSVVDPVVPGRARPTSLDLLAALGSPTARTLVSNEGFAGYDRALAALDDVTACVTTVPRAIARSGSGIERQRLFALAKLVERPPAGAPAVQRTLAYEDRLLLAALAGLNAPPPCDEREAAGERERDAGALPAIEPLPAFYARLAHGARRLAIGLEATSSRAAPSVSRATARLHETADLLDGLALAARESLEKSALSEPARRALAGFARAARTLSPPSAWSAEDVHVLVRDSGREVLVRTSGPIDELFMVIPGERGPELVRGPALAAREVVVPADERWDAARASRAPRTDPSWASHVVR